MVCISPTACKASSRTGRELHVVYGAVFVELRVSINQFSITQSLPIDLRHPWGSEAIRQAPI